METVENQSFGQEISLEVHDEGQFLVMRRTGSAGGLLIWNRPSVDVPYSENRVYHSADVDLSLRLVRILASEDREAVETLEASDESTKSHLTDLRSSGFFSRSESKFTRLDLAVRIPFGISQELFLERLKVYAGHLPPQGTLSFSIHRPDLGTLHDLIPYLEATGSVLPERQVRLFVFTDFPSLDYDAIERVIAFLDRGFSTLIWELSLDELCANGGTNETVQNLEAAGFLFPVHLTCDLAGPDGGQLTAIAEKITGFQAADSSREILLRFSLPSADAPEVIWREWTSQAINFMNALYEAGADLSRIEPFSRYLISLLTGPSPDTRYELDLLEGKVYPFGIRGDSGNNSRRSCDAQDIETLKSTLPRLHSGSFCRECELRTVCPSFTGEPALLLRSQQSQSSQSADIQALCSLHKVLLPEILEEVLAFGEEAIQTAKPLRLDITEDRRGVFSPL